MTHMDGVSMCGAIWIFEWWQLIAMAVLVGLIIFWLQYRKKQM